tara:strand:+ start:187 stop:1266 length:1080 start_codon:yes stop_codon:yes gene_type:complete
MYLLKKKNNLNKLYIFFFSFVLFINIISYSNSSENYFKVKEIEITNPFNTNFNKEKVINKGFKVAFFQMISMIATTTDQKKIKKTSIDEIKNLIDSFTVSDEMFINDLYKVKFDVNFNKKNTLKFFEKKNIFPSIPKKKEVLLIPVYVDIDKNHISLFNNNIFYNIWNLDKKDFFLLKYILPTEDLEDINFILENKNSIEEYDFKKIIKKYDLNDFIIIIINKNFKELKILSKINLNNNSKIQNQTFKEIEIGNDEVLSKIILQLKNSYEDYWKSLNEINTSIKVPLTISLDAKEYRKILNFEKTISELDLVFSYEISYFNSEIIHYKLIYNGSPNKFISDLKQKNIDVDLNKKIWKLK